MLTFSSYLLTSVAAVLAIPTAVFFLEIVLAKLLARRSTMGGPFPHQRPRIAALIPAHNEASGLGLTLQDVKAQLGVGDRLLVVADNCTDETAAVATSLGAESVVRTDPTKIGKGYALDWGLKYLAADAPDIVVVIDADCRLNPGALDQLAAVCEQTKRPVQSLYLMKAPADSSINYQVAEFAWRVKNLVRPTGLLALNLPCQLMGSGMAFPWHIIRSANLATGHIVEDLKLGLELAAAGHPPIFCPTAVVTSTFPTSAKAATLQRQRWEYGHIGLILARAPRLLGQSVKRLDPNLLALTVDVSVPPLSLLGATLTAMTLVTGFLILIGMSPTAFSISLISLLATVTATAVAWGMVGRDLLPPRAFALIASYFVAKLWMFGAAVFGNRVSRWIRTDRN